MSAEQMNAGIEALDQFNKKRASEIFRAILEEDDQNDLAWFYLSKAVDDPKERKHCLQMAVRLNPKNIEAVRELSIVTSQARLNPSHIPATEARTLETDTNIQVPEMFASAPTLASSASHEDTTNTPTVLTAIPGAPQTLSTDYFIQFVAQLAEDSKTIFLGRTPTEERVTWWQVWLTIGMIAFVNGLLFDFAALVLDVRLGVAPNVLALLTTPLTTLVSGTAAVAAGCYASHWYLVWQAGGKATLLSHFHTMVTIWAPAAFIMGILAALEPISFVERGNRVLALPIALVNGVPNMGIGSVVITLIALVIAVYTMFLMSKRLGQIHDLTGRPTWIAAVLMLMITALVFT